MGDTEFIINSVLCFINSARSDYSYDSLSDVVYCFYSHEEIKVAKEILCNLLKKDIVWRRDPDKKRKDLKDLLDFHEELTSTNKRINMVTKTHTKMPPVGLEMFAPVLTNLADQITKINEVLPKILDIKTEVFNTADTVRHMKIGLDDMTDKFASAIYGMEDAAKDFCDNEVKVIEELHSFRQSLSTNDVSELMNDIRKENTKDNDGKTYAQSLIDVSLVDRETSGRGQPVPRSPTSPSKVTDPHKGAISRNGKSKKNSLTVSGTTLAKNSSNSKEQATLPVNDDWRLVQTRIQRKRETRTTEKKNDGKVTGSKKTEGGTFKAAARRADVFVGRVDRDVAADEIATYIKEAFSIDPISVTKLDIRSEIYNAFKVSVKFLDRDKLFNAELWPEDILVKKFYNRIKSSDVRGEFK